MSRLGAPQILPAVFSGTTHLLKAFIYNPETQEGFKPTTLTLSIYDVTWPNLTACPSIVGTSVVWPEAATQTIINSRNDVDVLDSCDASGFIEHKLTADDLAVTAPSGLVPSRLWRRVLFTFTWGDDPDTPDVGKQEFLIPVIPDREPLAG